MPKYKSFTEYLQDNYYGKIKESLLDFVNENRLRNDDGVMMNFNNYEIIIKKLFIGVAKSLIGYAFFK